VAGNGGVGTKSQSSAVLRHVFSLPVTMIRRKSLMTCCTGTGLTACPTLFSFQDQGRPTDRDSAVPIPIINERLFVFISVNKKDG